MKTMNFLCIEIIKNDKSFLFNFPAGSSFQECFDALKECAEDINKKYQEAVEAQKAANPESDDVADKEVAKES